MLMVGRTKRHKIQTVFAEIEWSFVTITKYFKRTHIAIINCYKTANRQSRLLSY